MADITDTGLTRLLASVMHSLRADDELIDRILTAGAVGVAALLILWPAGAKQLWARRKWLGLP